MKIILVILINCSLILNLKAQQMNEYIIEIDINESKEAVWQVITDFEHYPKWNSVLEMDSNDSLIVGNEFDVMIKKENNKKSGFKATLISKEQDKSFAAKQKIIGKWFFQATHYFIVKEIDKENIKFIQKWELKGVVSSLFRRQIFRELADFKKMNTELKYYVEK